MGEDASRRDAHDLNNLFQVILGSLEVIRRARGDTPAETVETALRATREAAILAQRLLASLKRREEPARARPGETILLVEADREARRWAASALQAIGYCVLQAADAPAALELLQSPAAQRIDLLFSGAAMSGAISTRELAEAVARRGGLPVLCLDKPYDLERLSLSVRRVLDAG